MTIITAIPLPSTSVEAYRRDGFLFPLDIFTPQEAKRFAIVDDIVELNPEGESQDDVALWTVGW